MLTRREMLAASAFSGISLSGLAPKLFAAEKRGPGTPRFQLTRDVPAKYFTGDQCWVHPRAGIVPQAGHDNLPRVVMTMNTLDLEGSDVFKGALSFKTDDLGQSWTTPELSPPLAPRMETIDGVERPVALSDFWPKWHAASQTLLGTGHTVVYTPDWRVTRPRPRDTSYSIYDPRSDTWSTWKKLDMPNDPKFHDAGAGCVQRHDEKDGSILLPIYFHPPEKSSHVTVTRCAFDGKELKFVEQGNELSIDNKTRGLHEPSLTKFNDSYFLTLRNDKLGLVTRSRDGLQYEAIRPWTFDDGSELGNYNTQQHWVTHSNGLFLVYTRRGAMNDHVTRHRAPLFMAQVDPEKLCVIRDTETILVPERGARLGNFGVTDISPTETWVTVTEWMQPRGVEKYGSDGSLWIARLKWNEPNQLFRA